MGAFYNLTLLKAHLHFQRGVRGPSNEDGSDYFFMWGKPFWFTCVSCVLRFAGMVPGEDLAL